MADVYRFLEQAVQAIDASGAAALQKSEMLRWLSALARGAAPRSFANKALGRFQTAHLDDDSFSRALSSTWKDFTEAFLSGGIPLASGTPDQPRLRSTDHRTPRAPTSFHKLIAEWTIDGLVLPLSVNFDGLTRAAIRQAIGRRENASCVILTTPSQTMRFFLGSQSQNTLFPVVKVWGDIFHATCDNNRCPEFDRPVPFYDLNTLGRLPAAVGLQCPQCGDQRRLHISFPGHHSKDRETLALMNALWRHVAPRLGGIVIAGFSGSWDESLVQFLIAAVKNAEATHGNCHCVCIDSSPVTNSIYVTSRMLRAGISVEHIVAEASRFAESRRRRSTSPRGRTRPQAYQSSAYGHVEAFWRLSWASSTPVVFNAILPGGGYPTPLAALRHLGLKAYLHSNKSNPEHNRFAHARGATVLANYWLNALSTQSKRLCTPTAHCDPQVLCDVAMLATMHRDSGHLPFGHLTEEVFRELHWTVSPWTAHFSHDETVLESCWQQLRTAADQLIKAAAIAVKRDPVIYRRWVSAAIEGRSGVPFLDAVVNSPADAHKLDYVFRDCGELGSHSHLPHDADGRREWFERFIQSGQELLPSGVIALSGDAADRLRTFLEERQYLYLKHYHRPVYRVVERFARSVLTIWLTHQVPRLVKDRLIASRDGVLHDVGDVSSLKGSIARDLLWDKMDIAKCEAKLILGFADELIDGGVQLLPMAPIGVRWIKDCRDLLATMLRHEGDRKPDEIENSLRQVATWSDELYIHTRDVKRFTHIVREIEAAIPCTAVADVCNPPSVLAHPPRRTSGAMRDIPTDCFAVPDADPNKWHRRSGKWTSLSDSMIAGLLGTDLAQVIFASPRPNDAAALQYATDRVREECDRCSIRIYESRVVTSSMSGAWYER